MNSGGYEGFSRYSNKVRWRCVGFLHSSSSFLSRSPLFPHSTLLQTPSFHHLFISFIPKFYFTTVTRLPASLLQETDESIFFFYTIRSLGVHHISDTSSNQVSQPNLLECFLSFDEGHNKSPCPRGVLTRGSTFFPITFSQAAQRGLQFCGTYPLLDFKGKVACKMNTAEQNVRMLAQTNAAPHTLSPVLITWLDFSSNSTLENHLNPFSLIDMITLHYAKVHCKHNPLSRDYLRNASRSSKLSMIASYP